MERIKLSACLIVKNEESCLEKCLMSIKDIVDEIVIVDTGSTDGTAEIALKYTDKYYENEYVWEDSFCKARNYALNKIEDGWVFTIDADEELAPESASLVRSHIDQAEIEEKELISVTLKGGISEHSSIRIFKRTPEIYWKGDIHNYLSKPKDYDAADIVLYYGYSEAHEGDPDRALRILEKVISENPNSIRERYYYAREFYYRKDYDRAIEEFQKYLERASWLPEMADAHLYIARCYWYTQRGNLARLACLQAIGLNPNFKEALLLMADMVWQGPTQDAWRSFAEIATNDNVLFIRT